MSTDNKLYKCYKEGCYFRQDHPDGPFLTQLEYEQYVKDGNLNCPEGTFNCGLQELKPEDYPKPKKAPLNIKLIAAIAAGVLVIGGVVFFLTSSGSSDEGVVAVTEVVVEPEVIEEVAEQVPAAEDPEPVKVAEPTPVKTQPAATNNSAPKGTQTLTIGGNTYKGEVLNGKPHGMGTMYYKSSMQISPKDLKKRMADAGDYLTGEFFEGNVVQGKLFDAGNNVKDVIMVGR
jgi:hypothetical protein